MRMILVGDKEVSFPMRHGASRARAGASPGIDAPCGDDER
jgi:hypothetical protein